MKKPALVIGLILLAAESALASPNWILTWSDDFSAPANTAPSAANWVYDIGNGGWGNGELEYYSNRTVNARTDGIGNLVIEARSEVFGGSNYTSARIRTTGKFSQLYGRFESRIKIPYGQGIWPAFWMLGNAGGWPTCGEIDIMENVGFEPTIVHGTMHGPGYSGGAGVGSPYDLGSPVAAAYHLFAVEWEAGIIRWYVDNTLYETRTQADIGANTWVFSQPFYILLNVAVGGGWPGNPDGTTVFPQQMLVDYVRVYRRDTTQAAYKALNIPGTIQVEDFDEGGEGVAYHDLTVLNSGGVTRTSESVDLEATTDAGGGYSLGWTEAGEWLKYTVNIAAAGSYALDIRVAKLGAGGNLHFELDGSALAGSNFSIPDTGGWQTWATLPAQTVTLPAGTHVLRLALDTAGTGASVGNINWFRFTSLSTPTPTFTASPTRSPTMTVTRTFTPTHSPTSSVTLTSSPTPSITATFTDVPVGSSSTPSPTDSPTSTASPTLTATPSDSPTPSATPSQTGTFTHSPTLTATPSATQTSSPGPTATATLPATATPAPPGQLEITDSAAIPNPQSGPKLGIALRLSSACDGVSIRVYSSATTLVWAGELNSALPSGWSTAAFAAPELASGLYFYRLQARRGGEKSPSKAGKLQILK